MKKETEETVELSVKAEVFDWLQSIVFAIIACVLLFMFVARVVTVDGGSMNPTLLHGDRLIVSNLSKHYEQGDVVVFVAPEYMDEPLIKRVIATEGQTVDIDFGAGIVYVDGIALEEDYTYTPTNVQEGIIFPITIADGCIFVMGDNRNGSKDSRHPDIGMIDTREILGKAVFLVFPGTGEDENEAPRDFDRIGAVN